MVEMNSQIPGTEGLYSEKQRRRWETRDYKGSKKSATGAFQAIIRTLVFIFF